MSVAGFARDQTSLARYIDSVGRAPAIVHWFQSWTVGDGFQADAAGAAKAIDAVPMVSWEPHHGLEAVAAGEWDGMIRSYAFGVAAYPGLVLVRPGHEMNAPGIPWFGPPLLFVAAWRRMAAIFREVAPVNARLVWSPYVLDRGVRHFAEYYPGDEHVDWVALDGYNWGRRRPFRRWRSFDAVFARSYADLRRLAPSRPMMLAELGSSEIGGDKAAWIRDAFLDAIPQRYPALQAVVWFNRNRPDHADWRVDSSIASLAAWRQVVAEPRYAGRLGP